MKNQTAAHRRSTKGKFICDYPIRAFYGGYIENCGRTYRTYEKMMVHRNSHGKGKKSCKIRS